MMSPADAAFWLDALAAGALTAWLAGAWFVARSAAKLAAPASEEVKLPEAVADPAQKFARALSQTNTRSALGATVIDAVEAAEVRWHANGTMRHTGTLRVARDDPRRLLLELTTKSPLLTAAKLVVTAGLLVTAAIYVALRLWIVPSDVDPVRLQVFQMVQSVHVLWPPFLLAGLARGLRNRLVAEASRLASALPYA